MGAPKFEHKGFVRLVDHMGDDAAIVQAARVSYGEGTKTVKEDRGLIRYLMRHRHTSPFEMVEFKFHIRCPIFVARQWVRHRTASINEMSGRYSIMPGEFFEFEQWETQSTSNKQGRQKTEMSLNYQSDGPYKRTVDKAYRTYSRLIEKGVSREQARAVLPSSVMTEFYWKIDLHNLLHFLHLRCDSHAQKEIRDMAWEIKELITPIVPETMEAWEDYVYCSRTMSRSCWQGLRGMLHGLNLPTSIVPKLEKDDIALLKELGLNVPDKPLKVD